MRLFDLHCDTLYRGVKESIGIYDGKTAVDFGAPIDMFIQAFAAFVEDGTSDGYGDFLLIADYMKQSGIKPATKAKELCGSKAAIFTVENGAALGGNVENLEKLYNAGVRVITLTWNGKNELGSGCKEKGGLTGFGRQVIAKMNELNMAVDLSHINRKGFEEAIRLAENVLATHSCFDSIVPHCRNLTDSQALRIAEKQGIIGLCVYPEFAGPGDPFEAVAQHIMHGISLGIAQSLAIGTDFDGADMHKNLCCTAHMNNLYEYLCNYFGDVKLIDDIFYNNALRYFTQLLTKQD